MNHSSPQNSLNLHFLFRKVCGTAHFDLLILTSGGYCGFDPERKRAVAGPLTRSTVRGSGRNEGGRMCRYADGGYRSMRWPSRSLCGPGKHVMASPFSMASHLQFAFSLHHQRRCNFKILFSICFPKKDSSAHFSPQSCVGGAENWVLPVCFLGDAYLRTPLPSQRQQEIAIARTTTLASSLHRTGSKWATR